ncbi:MAG: zinc ribbon domain-containing protein [Bryobacterales bacterium]|nr:zinc ribbon domain-containing protein [Bryobacterales bacterium]
MLLAAAALLIVGAVVFTLGVREKDLPAPVPVSPFQHLDDRKAQIYENLRDLQFEFRVGKLSDEDYQKTKLELQRELANVLAEIDAIKGEAAPPPAAVAAAEKPMKQKAANVCPHCGAAFERALKFCGECGKPMPGGAA